MKKRTYLLNLALLLFCISAIAQPKPGFKNPLQKNGSFYKASSQLFETWITGTGNWRNSELTNYVYDSKGSNINYAVKDWDTIKANWFNISVDSLSYGTAQKHISYTWDSISSAYFPATLLSDSFSANTHTEVLYSRAAASWIAQYRDVYSGDGSGHDTQDVHQQWTGPAWSNSNLYNSSYDVTGHLQSIITKNYNGNTWMLTDKESYFYDANGNDTLYIHQSPDTTGKLQYVYINESKNSYNALNQLTSSRQAGSYDNKQWFPSLKYDYSYDNEGNDSQYTVQSWDSASKSWVNLFRYTFSYKVFTGITKMTDASNQLIVYPDPCPALGSIHYHGIENDNCTIDIVDLTGAMIFHSEIVKNEGDLDLNSLHLSKGCYIIKMISKNGIVALRKIMVTE